MEICCVNDNYYQNNTGFLFNRMTESILLIFKNFKCLNQSHNFYFQIIAYYWNCYLIGCKDNIARIHAERTITINNFLHNFLS